MMMSRTIGIDSNHRIATGRRYYLMIARQRAYLILIAILVQHAIFAKRKLHNLQHNEAENQKKK